MEIVYETDRLLLKLFEAGDVEDLMSFWGNEEVMAHCSGAIEQAILPQVIESYNKCHQVKGLSVYAVVEKETGKVIGAAGYNIRDSLDTIELLYHFAKASWGKGYATEAAAACLTLAKVNGNVKTIFASADPLNNSSLKILEKIGFIYQGLKWFDDTNQEEPYYEIVLN
ncbi:GNAT family N-acetyltransferase [Bacillus sp. CGMCC 1.16607]|uniref:GNAT family N-acetyltransferase n=1 Tax=Bacillus sp. CGMCC 1.16607 TaxID=3351842 RepID=UPI0036254DD2